MSNEPGNPSPFSRFLRLLARAGRVVRLLGRWLWEFYKGFGAAASAGVAIAGLLVVVWGS
jgi:hypothetical protein